jgi:hypothetical protein
MCSRTTATLTHGGYWRSLLQSLRRIYLNIKVKGSQWKRGKVGGGKKRRDRAERMKVKNRFNYAM